jgi:hypothetical protein
MGIATALKETVIARTGKERSKLSMLKNSREDPESGKHQQQRVWQEMRSVAKALCTMVHFGY